MDSFIKKSSFIYYTEEELKKAKDDIVKDPGMTAEQVNWFARTSAEIIEKSIPKSKQKEVQQIF